MTTLTLKEKGICSLCRAVIYEGDSGAVLQNGRLFCSASCADEVEYILDGGEVRRV
jgi:hypothetical protein